MGHKTPSMLRKVVKPSDRCRSVLQLLEVAAAGAGPPPRAGRRRQPRRQHRVAPGANVTSHAGLDVRLGVPPSARLLSEHAQHVRGPQRLCGLRSRHGVLQHLLLYDRVGDPVLSVCSARERVGVVSGYAACTIAPSGTVPLVTYRQSAMTSLRATATIPMRRARLPTPNRSRNHRVSALCGCHRTHVQAS